MQKFGLQLVTSPIVEPVTLAAAKLHLRVDFDDDDSLIGSLIAVAREHVESSMNRVIFNQTWTLTLDQFPFAASFRTFSPESRENFLGNGYFYTLCQIQIPLTKVSSITSITYVDGAGVTQTLDPSTYNVGTNSEPARIVPANGGSWPYPTSYVPGSVKVTFVAGTYGDGTTTNTCPRAIGQAMLLLIGHWYANREAVGEKSMNSLPYAVESLLSPYKFYQLAV